MARFMMGLKGWSKGAKECIKSTSFGIWIVGKTADMRTRRLQLIKMACHQQFCRLFILNQFRFHSRTLKTFPSFLAQIFCSLIFAGFASAQPLPKVEFRQVYTNLQIDRLVWMSEAPDGSGRFFAVGQAGKILIFKKDSDGGGAKDLSDSWEDGRRR